MTELKYLRQYLQRIRQTFAQKVITVKTEIINQM